MHTRFIRRNENIYDKYLHLIYIPFLVVVLLHLSVYMSVFIRQRVYHSCLYIATRRCIWGRGRLARRQRLGGAGQRLRGVLHRWR